MSFQWMVVSGFLYTEIGLCILLCLPFIQPKRWQTIFKSRLLAIFISYGNLLLTVFVAILVIFFADAVREIRKYSLPSAQQIDLKNNPNAQDHVLMMLFRSQRNLYITGFSLFLLLIIWRLCTLISQSAKLLASNEAIKKQAESANKAAEAMLDAKHDGDKKGKTEKHDDYTAVVQELEDKLQEAKRAEEAAQNDLNAMKSQAKAVTDEYDRLLEEHSKLQKQVEGNGDKKDD